MAGARSDVIPARGRQEAQDVIQDVIRRAGDGKPARGWSPAANTPAAYLSAPDDNPATARRHDNIARVTASGLTIADNKIAASNSC